MSFYQRFNQSVQFCHKYTFLRTSMPCNVWSSKTTACWVSLHLKYNNSSISYVCLQLLQLCGDYQKQRDAKNNNKKLESNLPLVSNPWSLGSCLTVTCVDGAEGVCG